MTTAANAVDRQVLQQVRRQHEQQRDGKRADHPRQLRSRARRLGHGRARGAAADRKSLEEARRQVGGSEAHHLLVRIHSGPGSRGIGARQDARVREGHHGDGAAADQHRDDVAVVIQRDHELRQALRQRAQHGHAGSGRQVEGTDHRRRADHRDEDPGRRLLRLSRKITASVQPPTASAAQFVAPPRIRLADPPQAAQRARRSRSRSRTAWGAG